MRNKIIILIKGTALYQLITVASLPIITRLYSPDAIGLISIYLSFFNFWLIGLSLRYESALLVSKDGNESYLLYRLSMIIVVVNALLAVPLLKLFQYFNFLGLSVLPSWTPWVAGLSLLGYGLFMLKRSYYLRLGEMRIISLSAVCRGFGNVFTRLLMGWLGFGILGLLIAEVIGSWAAYVTSFKNRASKISERITTTTVNRYVLYNVARKYSKFPRYELPSSLINQFALVLPVLLVGIEYGSAAAGLFGMARLVYALPNSQIGASVADVFQYKLAEFQRNDSIEKGLDLFYKLTWKLGLFACVTFLLAIVLAPILVPLIFGQSWREMGTIIILISPWFSLALVVSSLSRALIVLQKQELKLVYDFLSLILVLLSYYIAVEYKFELTSYVALLSFGMCISYFIYYFIIRYAFLRCISCR